MNFIAENFIEDQKNRLLVALYDENYKTCDVLIPQICCHAQKQINNINRPKKTDQTSQTDQGARASLVTFSENYEKRLRQILIIIKQFKLVLLDHCSPETGTAYDTLKEIVSDVTRLAIRRDRTISFKTWEHGLDLNQNQKALLYKTLMTFQLSSGCSNFCRRCNEWALPGVRSHFSFRAVTQILTHIGDQNNTHISLYGASDPLDWKDELKDISHVIAFAEAKDLDYSLLTKLPRGKKALLINLVRKDANLSVSVTNKNKHKILDVEHKFGTLISKQHDTDDLLIPAGLDEDFVSIKPSITDGYGCEITPDSAYIIIPTFTSALYPFGHEKIPVTKDTVFFPEKKTGRPALLVDYFKPLKGYDQNKKKTTLKTLLPVQIESILMDNGRYELTPPGMRSMKEYLSIFDEKARLQRKKMTPTIMKRLKQQRASQSRIQAHLDMCHPEACANFRRFGISFFLDAISRYQDQYKLRIILFLLKKEQKKRMDLKFISWNNRPIEDLISGEGQISNFRFDSFDVFRWLVFHLITESDKTREIRAFIKRNPAVYNSAIDLFVLKNIC